MKITPVSIVVPYRRVGENLQVWLQTRNSEDDLNGLLEFPGGKVEASEVPAAAAKREVAEETGAQLLLEELHLLNIYTHEYGEKTVNIYAYLCEEAGLSRFDEGGWVEVGKDWKKAISSRIPAANLKIFRDLEKEFLS